MTEKQIEDLKNAYKMLEMCIVFLTELKEQAKEGLEKDGIIREG